MEPDSSSDTLARYYAQRAMEYDEIYHRDDPRRQQEQSFIQSQIKEVFRRLNVLEVACGTGYWTQFASETANRITATDVNREVLEMAQQKKYSCPVSFEKADAFQLPFEPGTFSGGLANFWFSHIQKDRIDSFLQYFHTLLKPGSPVFIADNVYVAGLGGDLLRKENDGNTYKLRTLKNGIQQEILKNYFSKQDLLQIFRKYDPSLSDNEIFTGKCFWYVLYNTPVSY